ncbi:MAG: hypothetical protein IJ660_07340 [Alphaproteobacteria bacterium]|nr:hypothetical protein [Alphaproteobacteria bacterium]
MKKNSVLNSYKTKSLAQVAPIRLQEMLSDKEHLFLKEFQSLTSNQKQYVLATMKNLKKYHL